MESRDGPTYWGDAETVAAWMASCEPWESPVAMMENPMFWRLAGDVSGARVLDLGCGDGRLGKELLDSGAVQYHGVDPSAPLLARAPAATDDLTFEQGTIERFDPRSASFELVVSRLALHYVADLAAAIGVMARALVPGGALVYTLEHPAITSHESELSRDQRGFRSRWVIDDYFASGRREIDWINGRVTKYHRPLEDHFRAVTENGLHVVSLEEGRPLEASFGGHRAEYERRARIPLFLGIRAELPGP